MKYVKYGQELTKIASIHLNLRYCKQAVQLCFALKVPLKEPDFPLLPCFWQKVAKLGVIYTIKLNSINYMQFNSKCFLKICMLTLFILSSSASSAAYLRNKQHAQKVKYGKMCAEGRPGNGLCIMNTMVPIPWQHLKYW